MNWRDVLGTKNVSNSTYNTQNSLTGTNSTYSTYSTHKDAKLLDLLMVICKHLTINYQEVYESLSPEDIEDWYHGVINTEALTAFASAILQRREMDKGLVPKTYNCRAVCKSCGPIWLWTTGEVLGCPWCWNRAAGRPIPVPPADDA